jgi:hypothetical protein
MERTTKQIEEDLQAVEDDYQTKVKVIDQQISDLHTSGFRFVPKQEEALLEKRKIQENAFIAVSNRLQASLMEAKTREATECQAERFKKDEQAVFVKANALKEWEKAGGTPEEFEKTWPLIRLQMLQQETLKNMARQRDLDQSENSRQ